MFNCNRAAQILSTDPSDLSAPDINTQGCDLALAWLCSWSGEQHGQHCTSLSVTMNGKGAKVFRCQKDVS